MDTYPMTIGQLSVHRDVEQLPAGRLWEANLQPLVWDIRTPCTVEEVWQALGALAQRHESLRTNYLFLDGAPLQFLGAATAAEVLERVDRGVADIAELPTLMADKYQQELDIYHGIPWRAWIITENDLPVKVLYVVHHIAADGAASLIMQDDFHALLARAELPPPAGQPIALALEQQGAGAFRLRAAERYWRRTLEAAPRRAAGGAGARTEMLGATVQTGIPLEAAHAGAEALNVSLATVVLAAYYDAVRTVLDRPAILLTAISANRFDPVLAGIVTSLNQWAPMLLDFDGGKTFAELAAKVHGKALTGFKNSICDPDYVVKIRAEYFEHADPPTDQGFGTNIILAPPGFAPAVEQIPRTVEFAKPVRSFGPGFYFIVTAIDRIEIAVRCNRPDVDQAKLTAILDVFQQTLLGVAGLPAMG